MRPHPQGDATEVLLSGGELGDARLDHGERQLVDLAERARKRTRQLRHRRARVRLHEFRVLVRAKMQLPQAEHALVLVTKGSQVGVAQRC